MFDWNDLKYFLQLSRQKKLVHAAKSLGVDHSTVSRRINALEKATDSQLFHKTDEGYLLTEAGQNLYKIALHVEQSILQAQEAVQSKNAELSGQVRIGTPDGYGSYFLAPRLPQLIKAHPSLDIELAALPKHLSLSKREADITITLARPIKGLIYTRKLTDYHLQLCASKDYLNDNPPIKSTDDLSAHPFISYIEELIYPPELSYKEEFVCDLVPHFRSTNLIAQYKAVLAGQGIAILPKFITYDDPNIQVILPNKICLQRSLWLLIHESMHALNKVRTVADFITEETRKDPSIFLNI